MSVYSDNMPPSIEGAVGWVLEQMDDNKSLLDVGCSTGYFGSFIKQAKHAKVVGVEISEDAKKAKEVLDAVYSFDIEGNWPDELTVQKFDYIFFGDVIEHLKRPELALKEAAKLLKPEGKMFISTPNVAHVSVRLQLLAGSFEYDDTGILDRTHLKYFTKRGLSDVIRQAGLMPEKVDYSLNDLPKSVIEDRLEELGLKASQKFWTIINDPTARTHQFKVTAVKATGNAPVEDIELPPKVFTYRDDLLKLHAEEVRALKKHADAQANIIKNLEAQAHDVNHEYSGKIVGAALKVKALKKKITNSFKNTK